MESIVACSTRCTDGKKTCEAAGGSSDKGITGENFDEGVAPDTDAFGCTGESGSNAVIGGVAAIDMDAVECTEGSDFDENY